MSKTATTTTTTQTHRRRNCLVAIEPSGRVNTNRRAGASRVARSRQSNLGKPPAGLSGEILWFPRQEINDFGVLRALYNLVQTKNSRVKNS